VNFLDLDPIARAAGTVRMPGSKSISNRVLLLAALAQGETRVEGLLDSEDTQVMLEALARLGVRIERGSPDPVLVHGAGGPFPVKSAELHLGNAGTAFRPLTAVLAFCGGEYRLRGVPRMHERPIGDLVEALRRLGADIAYLGKEGFPPLLIRPGAVRGGAARVRGSVSSQYLSALLMAAPLAGSATRIEVEGELISKPYVEITLNLMRRFGVEVKREGWSSFTVPAARYSSPGEIRVEGDASSASYFLAAGAIGVGPVRVEGVGRSSIQGDVRFAEVLEKMGATVSMGEDWIEARGGGKLKAIDADLNHIPDAAMTAAVAALFAKGTSTLRNIGSWRVKETDRIAAMAKELRKLGAVVQEGADSLRITPPAKLVPATLDTYDDHRMAMSLSLAALGGIRVRINDPGCVAKTFPEYFDALGTISAPVIAIDGPSASGKGTVAQLLAKELGFHYLNSGALYRLVALSAVRKGILTSDEAGAAALASQLPTPRFEGEEIFLDGQPVADALRTEEVSTAASFVAALPAVRAALLERQRAFRRPPGLVAEGRDMGSVVFPEAELKVFLTASPEARAERRYKQLKEKGIAATLAALLQDLRERDARDATRSAAPLKQSPGARPLDTTSMSAEQAAALIAGWYREAKQVT
jgi:3-phosphoshikimate 1-carboxyvinyltransferase